MEHTIELYNTPIRKVVFGMDVLCKPRIIILKDYNKLIISDNPVWVWFKKTQDLKGMFRVAEVIMNCQENISVLDLHKIFNAVSESSESEEGIDSEMYLLSMIDDDKLLEIMEKPIPEAIQTYEDDMKGLININS